MKVLLISAFFPPTHVAGSEKHTHAHARVLLQAGHEVHVLCAGTWDVGSAYWNGYTDELYDEIPVRRIHVNWQLAPDPNRYLYNNPVTAEWLDIWLAEIQPDLVHIISCYTLSASVIEVAKRHDLPVFLTLVDYWFLCPRHTLLHADGTLCDGVTTEWDCLECQLWNSKAYDLPSRFLPEAIVEKGLVLTSHISTLSKMRGLRGMALNIGDRKTYLRTMFDSVDVVIALAATTRDVFVANGSRQDIVLIKGGQDLDWLAEMPTRVPSTGMRFGYIGQLIPLKGVHTLIEAFVSLGASHTASLDLYGFGEGHSTYTTELRSLAATSSAPITFKGRFPHSDLGKVLAGLDVLVVPSIWRENGPRVINEAFASGIPVIASDVGGMSEFINDGRDGLLFERGNSDDLARCLQQLIEEPQLLASLQANLPQIKSVEQEVHEILSLYESVRLGYGS